MGNMENNGKNKLSLPVAILIASVILGGFYYADQVSKQKVEQQAKKEAEQLLDMCLNDAVSTYHTNWTKECESRSLAADCSLPLANANIQDDRLEKAKAECFKRYQK